MRFPLALIPCLLTLSAAAAAPAVSAPLNVTSVRITSPSNGATVKGTVTITATATSTGNDPLEYIYFSDGVREIDDASCDGQTTCEGSVQWAATGLSGQHTLTADAYTYSGADESASITVNVVTPAPNVSLTSPVAGSKVVGTIKLTATASTDSALDDFPTDISFFDGVKEINDVSCQAQTNCQASLSWDTTGLSGEHSLTAQVVTQQGVSATSAPVKVTISTPPPTVKIVSPHAGSSLGHIITVRASGKTDPRLSDYPTDIAIYDGSSEINEFSCQSQQTCSGSVQWDARDLHGRHALHADIFTQQGASATSAPVVVGVSVTTRRNALVHCSLQANSVKIHQQVSGECSLSGVPIGTGVSILYSVGDTFHTIGSTHLSASGKVPFHLSSSTPVTLVLWIELGSTATTNGTRQRIGTVQIHR